MTLSAGTPAPDFRLPDQHGTIHSLADYRGKRLVLYFYPRDMTSGCTKQACGFSERMPLFQEKNTAVIGISKDSTSSHLRFQEKYSLEFPLLSDPDLAVHIAYDVIKLKETASGEKPGTLRSAFLIDEDGMVIRAFYGVRAADNPEEMLNLVRSA